MKNDMLLKIKKSDLIEFIKDWSSVADIDTDKAFDIAVETIKYIDRDYSYFPVSPLADAKPRPMLQLEQRWYRSLADGKPDFSVYDDQYILSDLWACWVRYSRAYLTSITSEKSLFGKSIVDDMEDVKVVADLGNSFGYTTAALKEIFPKAKVYGTNFKDGVQWRLAQKNAQKYNFNMVESVEAVKGPIDLVFASEYMEHFLHPVDHLVQIIMKKSPRYFVFANSFGTKSIGHFDHYVFGDKALDGTATSRAFNSTLKSLGYENIKTGCWNNKPTYWKKK